MLRSISELWTYPGLKILLCLCAGIVLGDALQLPVWHACIITAGLTAVAGLAIAFHAAHLLRMVALPAACIAVGMLVQSLALTSIDSTAILYTGAQEKVIVRGVLASEPALLPDGYTCDLTNICIQTQDGSVPTKSRARFTFRNRESGISLDDIPARVDTLIATGWLSTPKTASFPGGFDYRSFLNRQGITVTYTVTDSSSLAVHPSQDYSIWHSIHAMRMGIYRAVIQTTPPQRACIIIALLLGDRGLLPASLQDEFRSCGITHILAVSGLHTGIILLLLLVVFQRVPNNIRIPLIITGLWVYALLTGMAPPVVRAALMATIYLAGTLLQRSAPPVNTIAVAGCLILLFDPQALFTVSFQLSFLAAFSIALFYAPVDSLLRSVHILDGHSIIRGIRKTIALTIAAQIGTAPVLLSVFHGISIVSLVFNIFAVPAAFAIVVSALTGIIAVQIATIPGIPLLHTADAIARILMQATELFSSARWTEIHPGELGLWFWLCYGGIVLYFGFGKSPMNVKLLTGGLAIALTIATYFIAQSYRNDLSLCEFSFLDVGQGDATVIITPQGGTVLIDTGPNYIRSDAGRSVIIPFLHSKGITHLDACILTHADDDHIGGADAVLAAIETDTVYMSGISISKPSTNALDSVIAAYHIPVRTVSYGKIISISPDLRLYVLSPPPSAFPEEADNDASIVVLAVYGNTSVLLMGDADMQNESDIVHTYGAFVDADVLKAGHHGSGKSTGESFLQAVSPEYLIVSCGKNNRYKHPARRVLRAAQQTSARVLRTDIHGTITLLSDGETVRTLDKTP